MLRQLFSGHDAAYKRIEAGDPVGIERQRAERLLESAQNLPIVGIEKLALDVSRNYCKFVNLLAEIRFAILLARKGARVEVLRDQAFGAVDGRTTPDLRVLFPGGIEALVEVTTCSGWWPKLLENLDAAMSRADIGFRVEHVVGGELGGSMADHGGRTDNDALCEDVAREVVKGLADATRNGSRYGTIHVFRSQSAQQIRHEVDLSRRDMLPLPDDVMTPDGDGWLGSFNFEPAEVGIGRIGGGVTAAHRVDVLSHESRFLHRVERKARNRQKLRPNTDRCTTSSQFKTTRSNCRQRQFCRR